MQKEAARTVQVASGQRAHPKNLRLETLEQRQLLTANLLISEILASNDTGLPDEDGQRSDWIEIYNAGTSAADLNGWHLTDDAGQMNKWRFPAVTLGAGEYMVVFASGKNRIDPAAELHTNFSLNAAGEYLALVEPDGVTVGFDFAPAFPQQRADVSHGLQQNIDESVLIQSGAAARVLVPTDDSLGTAWTELAFDDSAWTGGATGVGYERTTGYDPLIATDVEADMYSVNESVYVRIPFMVDDPQAVFSLTLRMKYDDGFAAYLNGQFMDSRNAPTLLQWDSGATGANSDSEAVNFEDFDVSDYIEFLQPGENVLAIHGLNAGASSSDMLILPELKSGTVGQIDTNERLFFSDPSPRMPNGAGFLGLVEDTSFDVDRGFYDAPFDVTITTQTPGATIRYSTDGSEPTGRNGSLYTGPIHIDKTTTLRAYAFLDGFAPTNIDTQTYIFLDDVLTQTGAGLPTQWGFFDDQGLPPPARVTADYAIDPDVVGDSRYRDTIRDDLRSISTLSLVLDPNDLWSQSAGIYANPMASGSDWERTASVELIDTDGETEFQVDAGLRIHGGWGRRPSQTNKHSFRLLFKRDHGPAKLEYPWFGEDAADEFDTIVLRGGFNDSWAPGGNTVTTYANDQWIAETQREMGGFSPHSTYVHLYVNGLYWGLYSPTERPNASFAASYFGGDKEEYDAYVTGKLIDGNSVSWNAMFSLLRQSTIDYEAVQQILDVPSFIDYLIVNQYGGNWDWPHNNWYATRRREPDGKWRFHSWDAEGVFFDLNQNRVNSFGSNGPGEIYERLRNVSEFRVAFGDAVHRHFFHDGLLTPQKNIERLNAITSQIDRAIVGESARWGDGRTNSVNPPRTRDSHWVPRLNTLNNSIFPARGDIVLSQYRSAGLYPRVAAPEFNQHGGTIPAGFALSMSADRTIYYTLDGTDPRLPGGRINPDALLFEPGDPASPFALHQSTLVKARAVDSRLNWSALTEAIFVVDTPPALRITEIMYHPADPDPGSPYTDGDFEFIELQNTGGTPLELAGMQFTAGVAYTFPQMELAPGQYVVLVSNQAAFESRYGVVDNVIGEFTGQLNNGGERLRLAATFDTAILDFSYDDSWFPETDGDGHALVIVDATADPVSWGDAASWRASAQTGGTPGGDEVQRLPGDTNDDGRVDIDDLNNVRNNFGGAGLGDVNGDGVVNIDDLNEVRNHFGSGGGAPAPVSAASTESGARTVRVTARAAAVENFRRSRDDAIDLIHATWRMLRVAEVADSAAFRSTRGHRPAAVDAREIDAAVVELFEPHRVGTPPT